MHLNNKGYCNVHSMSDGLATYDCDGVPTAVPGGDTDAGDDDAAGGVGTIIVIVVALISTVGLFWVHVSHTYHT